MAIQKNGFLGPFTGKLGKVIGYVDQFGQQRLRTIGERNYDNPSIGMQQTWRKTALVTELLKPVMDFIRLSFAAEAKAKKISAYNVAYAENRKAVTGVFPDLQMDYSKVVLSKGDLLPAQNPEVIAMNEGLMFAWDYQYDGKFSQPTDLAMLMAYYPAEGLAFYLKAAASRKQGYAVMDMPFSPNGQILETYIVFISDDHKRISNSVYLGQIVFDKP
jgi:hypothetical protein